MYDEIGEVDDDAGGGSRDEAFWATYFRELFPAVTGARIDEHAKTYRNSKGTRG